MLCARNVNEDGFVSKFRVGISQGIREDGGKIIIPEFDLSPLDDDPRIECVSLPDPTELGAETAAGLDAAILMLEAVTRHTFEPPGRLALVARFGVGYDRIDVDACTRNAVALAITPDGVRRPVAVSVITLMLALTSRLLVKDRIAREGPTGWARKAQHNGVGLVGRTLGSLGMGNIGTEVFKLAQPFDMRFIAHDPYADSRIAAALGVTLVSLEGLFRESDVLSVSCPLSETTRGIVDAPMLELMKPSAFLINTSRGGVVDQAALVEALQAEQIAGAGLDVLAEEPPDGDDPILSLENVILSPHALCWTDQCMAGNGAADVAAVRSLMRGRPPAHVVNVAVIESADFKQRLNVYAKRFSH
jgi:phosphoglycerate dehydrogenase-like enzyme